MKRERILGWILLLPAAACAGLGVWVAVLLAQEKFFTDPAIAKAAPLGGWAIAGGAVLALCGYSLSRSAAQHSDYREIRVAGMILFAASVAAPWAMAIIGLIQLGRRVFS